MKNVILLFLLGILFIFLAMSFFGFNEVLLVLQNSNYSWLWPAITIQLVIMFLYAARYKIICSKHKKISIHEALYITVLGNFMDLLTPIAKVGGQPVMIYLTRKKIGSAKASAVVMTDTVIDIITSILTVTIIILLFFQKMPVQLLFPLVVFVILVFLILTGFLKLFLSKKILSHVVKWAIRIIGRFHKIHIDARTSVFGNSFRGLLKDGKIMGAGFFLSILLKILEFARIWIIFMAIGIDLPAYQVLIIWSFMLLLMVIPFLPGSLGLMEFGITSAFILFGMGASQAAAGVLLDRLVSFWFVIIISLVMNMAVHMQSHNNGFAFETKK